MRAVTTLAVIAILATNPILGQMAHKTRTFRNSDGAFRFVYPADFQVCTQGNIEPCNQSFIPVCKPDALVCVVYPAEEFKGTSLDAASFQVREIFTTREMMTADVCVTPYPRKDSNWPEFLISAKHPVEMIGPVEFVHGVSGGAATSHASSIDLYRMVHKQRCFELSVSETGTNPNSSDPPLKTLTPAQQDKLQQAMSDILHSFRFIQ